MSIPPVRPGGASAPRPDSRSAPRRASRPARAPGTTLLLAAAGLLASASAPAADRPVELRFAGEFAGRPVDCGATYDGIGTAATSVRITDYRLYVSNVRLLGADGASVPMTLEQDDHWQVADVALLDFEDGTGRCDNGTPETNATVRGTVPDGEYTGIAFELGVPFAENHGDPTLQGSPLNLTAMFWNWQGGYRFLKLDTVPAMATAGRGDAAAMPMTGHDGDPASAGGGDAAMPRHGDAAMAGHGGAAGAWMLHVGSAGCASVSRTSAPATADDCAAPNRTRVELDGFDLATDTVVVDPATVLAGSDLGTNAPDTAPGCMSAPDDPDCGPVMEALGLGPEGEGAPTGQRLFVARNDGP